MIRKMFFFVCPITSCVITLIVLQNRVPKTYLVWDNWLAASGQRYMLKTMHSLINVYNKPMLVLSISM